MAHNSRFVHTRIIWQAVNQAKPDSPKCVNWILQRIILSQLNEMKRNEMCLLFAKFKFWGKNCTYIIRAVTRALRWVHHCAKVREAIPFYFSLYIHCICICICTSICIYTPIAFAIALNMYLLGVPRSERRFLFCFSLYIHTTCDCCCFFRPACYMRMQNRIQPDVVTMRCARYVKAWF